MKKPILYIMCGIPGCGKSWYATHKMIKDNRIKFFAAADYNEDTEIDLLVKAIIDRTAVNEKLENEEIRKKLCYR